MCGICGFYGFEDENLLRKMLGILSHRGPEDTGYFNDQNISLGHTRLSIIDLVGGHQPVHNEDNSIWVVLNGEIFNYRELRENLKGNHEFYSNSDTEVLVHLYEEHKENLVNHLRGQFAFALWDANENKLILVRDRLGICPLYYAKIDSNLIFASEIKALLCYEKLKPELNIMALNEYLIFQAPLGPNTLFKGINELLPGHTIILTIDDFIIKEYWNIMNFSSDDLPLEHYTKLLLKNLEESIKFHLVSDVPVGMYLSGGIDSSIIASLFHRLSEGRIETFTLGFEYEEFNEIKYATLIAESIGANAHHVIIDPETVLKNIDTIIWHLEDPIADFGEIKDFFLAKETRNKGIKVVITGGGGDELFGGYGGYKNMVLCTAIKEKIPFPMKSILSKIADFLPLSMPKSAGIKRYLRRVSGDEVYMSNGGIFTVDELRDLCQEKFINLNGIQRVTNYFDYPRRTQVLNRCQYLDLKVYIDAHLIHDDKVNMAHAVEIRHPFLDYKLCEFAFTLPPELRIRDGVEKYILRKMAFEHELVPEIIAKRKKRGFSAPEEYWLSKNTDFKDYIFDSITNSRIINQVAKKEKVQHLLKPRPDHWQAHKMWGLFILSRIHDTYFS